jgi:tetraacyldisaccharide 4'-kinase
MDLAFNKKIKSFPLIVLSKVYEQLVRLRSLLFEFGVFKVYKSFIPIICIGNVSIGGNGKSPLVQLVVQLLRERGYNPVIISRGYGGRLLGPVIVTEKHSPKAVGDEALMLALTTNALTVIAKERVSGVKFVEQHNLGNVIVLDDGLQHFKLSRNVNIVTHFVGDCSLINFKSYPYLLPATRLRESPLEAFKRIDIFVLALRGKKLGSEEEKIISSYKDILPSSIVFLTSQVKSIGIHPLDINNFSALSDNLKALPTEWVVVSGLANPEGFLETVKSLGVQPKANFNFPDHYSFTQSDFDKILKSFPTAAILCSEKDSVKLKMLQHPAIYVLKTKTGVSSYSDLECNLLKKIADNKP